MMNAPVIDKLDLRAKITDEFNPDDRPILRPGHIAVVVADKAAADVADILGSSRSRRHVQCRMAVTLLLRGVLDASYPEIARLMNRTAHTSPLYWMREVESGRLAPNFRDLVGACYLDLVWASRTPEVEENNATPILAEYVRNHLREKAQNG